MSLPGLGLGLCGRDMAWLGFFLLYHAHFVLSLPFELKNEEPEIQKGESKVIRRVCGMSVD